MHDPRELFDRWYIKPLKSLEEMPNGDGGFVALAVSCALYERYAAAVIKRSGGKAEKQAKCCQFTTDFGTDQDTAEVFWNIIRDGLVHHAMPLQCGRSGDLPRWSFHHSHESAAELATVDGRKMLKVNPWHFMNKVSTLRQDNFDLLAESKSFPWGNIV